MEDFRIAYLDHVALRVQNLELSSKWYHEVLGLKVYIKAEWGNYPVFLMAGKSGIALFPADKDAANPAPDHFAFNVDAENFQRAQTRLTRLGIPYEIKDHIYFHSIYFRDPDDHQVELTCLVVSDKAFFGDD